MAGGYFRVLGLTAASMLALAGPTQAQSPRGAEPPAASKPVETPAATAPPPQPFRTVILSFDNWSVTCRDFTEGKRKHICFANLQIVQQKTSQVVFTWTIGYDADIHLMTTFQTPTGISIAPGLELKLAKATRTVPFATCESGHCTASIAMDATFIRELNASPAVEASLRGSNGNTFRFDIPMKGFDKAYAALK